jgi:hypothetical protein
MPPWRKRECPFCGAILDASDFPTLTYGANWKTVGEAERSCPDCGHTAKTREFRVVRERHENEGKDTTPYMALIFHRYPCVVCHQRMEDGTSTRTRDGLRSRHKDCVEL